MAPPADWPYMTMQLGSPLFLTVKTPHYIGSKRYSPESLDVVLEPLNSKCDIHQPSVDRCSRRAREAEDVEAVVEGHDDMLLGPMNPLIRGHIQRMASALLEPTTDYPDDNRQLFLCRTRGWRRLLRVPDIEIQAVLALRVSGEILGQELLVDGLFSATILIALGLVSLSG